ncbi:MAG TPA: prolyl oligopeptidase family serine peptidase [Gemmatimonadota bacterium]|nr:prolyl oligopeptidase family serine peptidase [Gemmatimonadota bacterium]
MRIAFAFALVFLAAGDLRAQQSPERRTALDGSVVLEDAPEIPPRVVDALNRYQSVRSAGLVDWTADGRGIYVGTRFADVTQIHRVDMPGGARRQLTFFEEPVSGSARRPEGDEVLFSMDEGGSEFYQLWLLDPETGDARRLTDGVSRNSGPEWSEDGARLAWTSTRRNGRSNDVWVMAVDDTSSARVAVAAPDGASWSAGSWLGDSALVVAHYVSVTDSRLHLLDLDGGALRPLAGSAEDPASWAGIDPEPTPDGAALFVVTDAVDGIRRLGRLTLESGEFEVLTGDLDWDVESFAIDDSRRRAAFVVNEGGIGRLYLMDPATGGHAAVPSIPTGLIGGLEFSPDGTRLGLTLNTPKTPSDAFVLELGENATEAGELVRWTFSEVGGLDTDSFVAPQIVHYPTFDSVAGAPREIPAFVYRPSGVGPHPVIVYIHGGPESQYRPSFSSTFQLWLAKLGVAVIAPNVRGSAGYGREYLTLDNGRLREDSVRDIGALLDWIATQPDLDADRVAVYGGSYGGYMVLASLVHFGDRLRAGVDYVGISNFVTFLENTEDYRRDVRRPEYGDERDSAMREFLESISPANHAGEIESALFVVQGANDPRVPASESEQIAREVRANGQQVWTMTAANEGHGFAKKPNQDLLQQLVFLFFEENLLPAGMAVIGSGHNRATDE